MKLHLEDLAIKTDPKNPGYKVVDHEGTLIFVIPTSIAKSETHADHIMRWMVPIINHMHDKVREEGFEAGKLSVITVANALLGTDKIASMLHEIQNELWQTRNYR